MDDGWTDPLAPCPEDWTTGERAGKGTLGSGVVLTAAGRGLVVDGVGGVSLLMVDVVPVGFIGLFHWGAKCIDI